MWNMFFTVLGFTVTPLLAAVEKKSIEDCTICVCEGKATNTVKLHVG